MRLGRWSVFRDKKHRVQGHLTDEGKQKFDELRAQLRSELIHCRGEAPGTISDADVMEFAVRGWLDTRRYLGGR